ncbi:4-hydroxy-2-oxoheptanedioate aldolase [Mesorhizobium robiniae]|uniref:4-hydroxy-2-oxoheptanedioate aldolase n=1 Tax=Mesorhizobium robiniae TaxID=559315 RepID=A0ABV2GP13_9HYPH
MKMPVNGFKARLTAGPVQIGFWTSLCSATGVEVLGQTGFDWLLIDTEHAPNELSDVLSHLRASSLGDSALVVRPAWNDAVLIKRILDIGAANLLIPFIQNETEAAAAVKATRYPPVGTRGVTGSARASNYGKFEDYFARANEEICVMVQVETRSALDKLTDIASVEGVDGVFLGPSDLAASFGHLGLPQNGDVQSALRDAVRRLQDLGKPAGILTTNREEAERYIEWGYRFVAVGTDINLLSREATRLRECFR